MKRSVVIPLATAFCICATAFSAHAHHSYGTFFDLCASVTIEGRVESVQWKDPHVWINLTTDGGSGYRAEWTSTQGLARNGITAESVKAGDRVVVTGSPMKDRALIKDPAVKALMPDPASALTVVSALTQIRRMSDGWSWRNAGPPDCRQ